MSFPEGRFEATAVPCPQVTWPLAHMSVHCMVSGQVKPGWWKIQWTVTYICLNVWKVIIMQHVFLDTSYTPVMSFCEGYPHCTFVPFPKPSYTGRCRPSSLSFHNQVESDIADQSFFNPPADWWKGNTVTREGRRGGNGGGCASCLRACSIVQS